MLIVGGIIALVMTIVINLSQPFQLSDFVRASVRAVGLGALGSSFLLRLKQPQRANQLLFLGTLCMFISLILSISREL